MTSPQNDRSEPMASVRRVCVSCGSNAGGEAIGVMPGHLVDHEVGHTGLTRLEVTGSMHERKVRMVELADGVIALPGGAAHKWIDLDRA